MGNCQAAEAATVVIQHPGGGRTELAYWALPAGEVMSANPGHYVAAVITAPATTGASVAGGAAPAVKHLKLLRPDDTLLLGRVYRLVSFEGTSRASYLKMLAAVITCWLAVFGPAVRGEDEARVDSLIHARKSPSA